MVRVAAFFLYLELAVFGLDVLKQVHHAFDFHALAERAFLFIFVSPDGSVPKLFGTWRVEAAVCFLLFDRG